VRIESRPVHCIVFSRDRAMQLDAFLGSLNLHASTVYTAISVLYTATSDRHRSSYDVLIERFPKVAWVEESTFSDDLRDLVGPDPLTVFHTDDDIFFRTFPAPELQDDEVCFSLRLGLNTVYCYPLDISEKVAGAAVADGRMRWIWRDQGPGSFGYPLALNGHVFRTSDVQRWLEELSYANPNELEAALQTLDEGLPPMMASFEHSVVASIPLNVVNDVYENRAEWTHGVDELNERFLLGERIDHSHMDFSHVVSAHESITPAFTGMDPSLAPIFEAWAQERRKWSNRLEGQAARLHELDAANTWLAEQRLAWEETARRNSLAVEELQAQVEDLVTEDDPNA
jgi:hypothetical protein